MQSTQSLPPGVIDSDLKLCVLSVLEITLYFIVYVKCLIAEA